MPAKTKDWAAGWRVMSLSMVKNEQDIIEPFIRHHARLVDCMVVMDNASVDATRRIATACARELGNVVVIDGGAFAYTQSQQMTSLLERSQSAFGADFVLLLDADEFVDARDRAAMLAVLERIPRGGVGHLRWRTFVHEPGETEGASDPPRSFRWRRADEVPSYGKAVLRLDGEEARGLRVDQGNHDVAGPDGARLTGVPLDDAALLHFPVRSRDQLAAKGVVGWMACLAAAPDAASSHNAFQWRKTFERVAGGERLDLCEASISYAQDRRDIDWRRDAVAEVAPVDYVRRYSDGRYEACLSVVARSWERSLAAPVRVEGEQAGWRRFLDERVGTGCVLDGQAAPGAHLPAGALVVTAEDEADAWMRLGWEIDRVAVVGVRCLDEACGSKVVLRRCRHVEPRGTRPWLRRVIGRSR